MQGQRLGHALMESSTGQPPDWVEPQLRKCIPGIEHVEVKTCSGSSLVSCADRSGKPLSIRGLHLQLTVVSTAFDGCRLLQRHQMVNHALESELMSGVIHSLPQLSTLTPAEWKAQLARDYVSLLEQRLRAGIDKVEHIEIEDVSDGHTAIGFTDGSKRSLNPRGIELKLLIVSSSFDGLKLIDRHRMVSNALEEELLSGTIHSLPHLKTWTPDQWRARSGESSCTSDAKRPKTSSQDCQQPKM